MNIRLFTGILFPAAMLITPVHAAEGGSGSYFNGYSGPMAAYMPEPGTFATNYTIISSGKLKVPIVGGIRTTAKIKLVADIVELTQVTPYRIFGGQYAFSIAGGYAHASVEATASSIFGSASVESKRSGFTDLTISPINLGWKNGYHSWLAGLSIVAPTASFDKNRLVNIGLNRWVIEPNLAYTYFNPNTGREVSLNLTYDYNFENRATRYKSGQEMNLDYTITQYFSSGLGVGVGGYIYQQITDDKGAAPELNGFRGRAIAIGPQLLYHMKLDDTHNLTFQAKYHKDIAVKNRFKGGTAWFNLTLNF